MGLGKGGVFFWRGGGRGGRGGRGDVCIYYPIIVPRKAAIYIYLLKAPDALDSVGKSFATSTHGEVSSLSREGQDTAILLMPSTWAIFLFLPTIGVTPKDFWFQPPKSLLQRSDYTSLLALRYQQDYLNK